MRSRPRGGGPSPDLARLRASVGVRIAVDESLHDLRDAAALLRAGAVDVFVIKLIKTEGLLPTKRITDLGESAGVSATVVSPFDTQVGAAHALHLVLTLPFGGPARDLTVFATQADRAVTGHRVDAGVLHASFEPGCGAQRLDELRRSDPLRRRSRRRRAAHGPRRDRARHPRSGGGARREPGAPPPQAGPASLTMLAAPPPGCAVAARSAPRPRVPLASPQLRHERPQDPLQVGAYSLPSDGSARSGSVTTRPARRQEPG